MDNTYATRWSFNLVGAWIGTNILSLLFASFLVLYLSIPKTLLPQTHDFKLYSALPPQTTEVSDTISSSDGREAIIRSFFNSYNSPLNDQAHKFIEVADKHQLDYKLLPAIAMQESNGGKRVIKSSFNPFGFGIYGSKVVRFSSWEEGIETVGKTLREDYLDQGLKTPEQIMTKYTPPSLSKGGGWAKGVRSFMEELK